jgi:hypothetical protein
MISKIQVNSPPTPSVFDELDSRTQRLIIRPRLLFGPRFCFRPIACTAFQAATGWALKCYRGFKAGDPFRPLFFRKLARCPPGLILYRMPATPHNIAYEVADLAADGAKRIAAESSSAPMWPTVPLVNSILSKINDLRGGLAIRYLHVKNVQ